MAILTIIFKIIAAIAEPIILLILALLISIALYFNKQKSKAILFSTASLAAAATIELLKEIIKAPRPVSMLIQETGYSFPSGHTTFAVVFFGLLVYIFAKTRKQKVVSLILAVIAITAIALSRLYLQVHYLRDVLGGLIIGAIILVLSIFIHKQISTN